MPFKWKQTPKSPTYLLGFGKQKLTFTLQIPQGLNLQYHYLSLAGTKPLQGNRHSAPWFFKAILCPLLAHSGPTPSLCRVLLPWDAFVFEIQQMWERCTSVTGRGAIPPCPCTKLHRLAKIRAIITLISVVSSTRWPAVFHCKDKRLGYNKLFLLQVRSSQKY